MGDEPDRRTTPRARAPRRPRGYTKTGLLADGFTADMLADLVREGLATAQGETLRVGGRPIRAERYRITDAGRRAIES